METIQVSKAVYNEIMSRRIGRESISTTLHRELNRVCEENLDVDKLDADMNHIRKTAKYYDLDDVLNHV